MDENPPRSTHEVIHYNEYFARLDRKEGAGSGFDARPFADLHNPLTVEHLGEFHWRFLVGDHDALGWVDDRVTIAQDDHCQPTVLVETKWQDEKHARTFRDAYVAFLRKRGLEPLIAAGGGTTVKVAYGVDDVQAVMDEIAGKGIRLIDSSPRHGAMGSSIAFLHPKDTGGVLTELVQAAGKSG